jgi:hypothetical protein
MSVHVDGPTCPGCDAKKLQCNPDLQKWFDAKKAKHPDLHISWGFRGEADQELLYKEGKTMAHFGQSKHNCMNGDLPCSEAMDLFQLIYGTAVFNPEFYNTLHQEDLLEQNGIEWAGLWITFKETDHFQLPTKQV